MTNVMSWLSLAVGSRPTLMRSNKLYQCMTWVELHNIPGSAAVKIG